MGAETNFQPQPLTSIHDLQPMQQPEPVAGDEAIGRNGGKRRHGGVELEAGGFGPCRRVPQPDRVVIRARGKPPVCQHAKSGNPVCVPLETGDLGPGREVPQPNCPVIRAGGEPTVIERAKNGYGSGMPLEMQRTRLRT